MIQLRKNNITDLLDLQGVNLVNIKISKNFVEIFLRLPPSMNPKFEFKNVISVIKIAGFIILFPYNDNVIPAEKASILVAIPIKSKQIIPMQLGLFLFLSKASFINFRPK